MMKYVVIILSALFVIISCTPKDRTARINEIYEELEKEVADETKDESKTPDENLEPDDEQVEEDAEIIDESDEKIDEISDEDAGDTVDCSGNFPNRHKGLCWSDKSPDEMTWSDAISYCEGLGGRLPYIQELRMLIQNCPKNEYPKPYGQDPWCEIEHPGNLGGSPCAGCNFDGSGKYSAFGDIGYFWSSSSDPYNARQAWNVDFYNVFVLINYKTQNYYARCVSYSGDTGDTGDTGTCTGSDKFCHSHDGLDWSDASSYYMTWSEATTYCKNLGGRLPTISELRELIQNCPATETGGECGVTDGCLSLGGCWDACGGCEVGESGKYSVFGDTNSFWSSSELSEDADKAWVMGFGYGGVGYGGKNALVFVRCVRNGE